ncbi:hypothetical protein [Bifidobacterium sp. ESL0745]|uniref:hypothetical protein n=1 Tax=Bifidobacterium sp. ESL0745 TaxID=2983226 RepID=UPI0023F9A619|nr:hypothetical protein [Bifidobacterium sp. ESL0745]MDF7665741.1 hypothetical protein [Bifidobacterium sp. ESL0745]
MTAWAYQPHEWHDKGDGGTGTPITAERLDEMDAGIANIYALITPPVSVRKGDPSPVTPCLRIIVNQDGSYAGSIEYDDGRTGVQALDETARKTVEEHIGGLLAQAPAAEPNSKEDGDE